METKDEMIERHRIENEEITRRHLIEQQECGTRLKRCDVGAFKLLFMKSTTPVEYKFSTPDKDDRIKELIESLKEGDEIMIYKIRK